MAIRRLVLDANILVRAVLGRRVKVVIVTHAAEAVYVIPEAAYGEAEQHIPDILATFGRMSEVVDALA